MNIHALPVAGNLTERQQSMLNILIGAMKDVRSGRVEGLSIVRLLKGEQMVTQWTGDDDKMTTLLGATHRLVTEMAMKFSENSA